MGRRSKKDLARELERESVRGRVANYAARRRAAGEVRVSVWVPKKKAEEIKKFAAILCGRVKPNTPPVKIPMVVEPPPEISAWSFIQAERDEVWLHMLLKANGAKWQNKTKEPPNTWRLRSDLVKKLGLEPRVVSPT